MPFSGSSSPEMLQPKHQLHQQQQSCLDIDAEMETYVVAGAAHANAQQQTQAPESPTPLTRPQKREARRKRNEDLTGRWEPHWLRKAIMTKNQTAALELLQLPDPPGLNTVDPQGYSMLMLAIVCDLPDVGLAILHRPDFQQLQAQNKFNSWTALDYAAYRGQMELCDVLLGRAEVEDFLRQRLRARGVQAEV